MGRNQCKKAENTRNQNASPPTGDCSSSSAREQGLTEDECDELTESGFRRWIIRNFCELKEHVLTQCKETKNLERRFNEMLMRMDNLEKNINELMELKNTTRELREACTSFNSRIDQAEERISEVEDQLNEIKREGKMIEKRVKRNEQSLQEIWDYVKRPNLRLIGVPECDEENESKLENTLQDIIQENFPNLARQANIQVQKIQRTPQRYSSRKATPRHIIIRFTRVEMKEKMLRAAREKGRVTHKGKPIRLTADLSAETLQARREWEPTFNILKENHFQPRISYPAKLSFISEGKIKFFANKEVLRDYITTRPALQELLKEALHMDGNNQYQLFQKHTKRNHKGWSEVAQSWLTVASASQVQCLTLLPRLHCSGVISAHYNLCLLGSSNSPCLSLPKMGFRHVGQAGHELLTSSDPPISASQNRFFLCLQDWSAMVLSQLTATSASWVPVILLPSLPNWSLCHQVEMGREEGEGGGLCRRLLLFLPTSSRFSFFLSFFNRDGVLPVGQADLELLTSGWSAMVQSPLTATSTSWVQGFSYLSLPRGTNSKAYECQRSLALSPGWSTVAQSWLTATSQVQRRGLIMLARMVLISCPRVLPALASQNKVWLYHPGWTAVMPSWLTVSSTSQAQAIFPSQPPELLGLQTYTMMPG
ncbi:LINE-1 retrotransposable element ORF1 protein [Plecturocebus cupreus]